MPVRKLWFFTMLATIIVVEAVGRLSRRINQLDPPRYGSHQALRAKREMRPSVFLHLGYPFELPDV